MEKTSTTTLKNILIVIAIILAMVISFFLGRASVNAPEAQPAPEEQQSAEAEPSQAATESPQYADSQEKPEILELLRAQPRRVDGDPRAMGKVDAPVVMVAYEDFSCPMCTVFFTNVYPQLKPLVDEGKLRIEFHDLTIFPNYGSDKAARGARAAANQGKFWEYTETAYHLAGAGNHPTYDDAKVLEIAQTIGITDLDKFEADYNAPETTASVKEETDHAMMNIGITGTPFFIVNDAVISGAQPVDYFRNTIARQLELAG
ncbi:thioredoxin domain-containing protein [uncultured Actinomyces sp.]|uniref:DsbA family protein n=1 Tax=uncultured Actinomyces sp. TaxID=249061 RepID=UPI00260B11C0|nr:thioredoxin domain-containing protein [uncultured Actinomyces sp.]